MKCAKDTLVLLGVMLTVVSVVSGVLIQNTMKASAEVQQVREDYRADVADLRGEVNTKLASMDSKLDRIIDYQLNHAP